MKYKINTLTIIFTVVVFSFGFFSLGLVGSLLINTGKPVVADDLQFDEQEATVRAIKKAIPAVVSIIVYDYKPYESVNILTGKFEVNLVKRQMIKGTGFIISSDGYIITNRHVVDAASEEDGEYQIILNSGKKYYAQLIAKDNANDLAVLKIFDKDLPFVELGESSKMELGMSVIAIGNALGLYENSVTKGIVSGLERSLVASDMSGNSESLTNVIQTDAKINQGNSGGPLVNLQGEVVGINTAIEAQGSAIGFAIPIDDARPVINSIIKHGLIYRPYLGVRYMMITHELAHENNLARTSGAWITTGSDNEIAVMSDSPASAGGIMKDDIIFEINAVEIDEKNTLLSVVQGYRPGDRIGLKILRDNKEIILEVTLGELK